MLGDVTKCALPWQVSLEVSPFPASFRPFGCRLARLRRLYIVSSRGTQIEISRVVSEMINLFCPRQPLPISCVAPAVHFMRSWRT